MNIRSIRRWLDTFPAVGRLARDLRDRRDLQDVRWSKMPGHGFWIRGGNWMAAGADAHEGQEVSIVAAMLDRADLLIDVGANSGIFSCLAASLGKPVWAVEAMPANVPNLLEALERNGFGDRVEVFALAASDRVGVLPLYGRGQAASLVKGWANGVAFDRLLVATNTLDNLFADRIGSRRVILKIDVEGAELQVLQGAGRILERCDGLLVEISLTRNHPGGINPDLGAIFTSLWRAGFRSFVADGGDTEVDAAMVARWSAAGHSDLATENFYFVRSAAMPETA